MSRLHATTVTAVGHPLPAHSENPNWSALWGIRVLTLVQGVSGWSGRAVRPRSGPDFDGHRRRLGRGGQLGGVDDEELAGVLPAVRERLRLHGERRRLG